MGVSLQAGQVFANDFKVVEPLAEGGMGSLWIVEQLGTGKRRALKTMNVDASDETTRKRFAQEARIGAMISSEHVVDVIAAGVDGPTGTPWLVMELLEGEDLDKYTEEKGALAPGEVKEIFRQLCHAVSAAHDIPIVHRDLKPENVFLAKSRLADQSYLVKVLDFGIAKVLTGQIHATGNLGTPLWMSPEQTDTRVGVSPATDVWALGLIAFRLLSGRYYWLAAYASDAQPATILREILFENMPAAPARAAELNGAELPPGFDAWFAKCTDRDKGQRFQHAREAYQALSSVLSADASTRALAMSADQTGPNMALAQTQGMPAGGTGPQAAIGTGSREVVTGPQGMVGTTGGASLSSARRTSTGWIVGAVVGMLVLLGAGGFGVSRALRPTPVASPLPKATQPVVVVSVSVPVPVLVRPSATVVAVGSPSVTPSATVGVAAHPTATSHAPVPVPSAKPKGSGLLSVNASGGWCNLSVDGAPQGSTPIAELKVTEGPHVIKCEPQGGDAKTATVTVKDGETLRYKFTL